jgi:hypothetical protein
MVRGHMEINAAWKVETLDLGPLCQCVAKACADAKAVACGSAKRLMRYRYG